MESNRKEWSIITAAAHAKCPRCRTGNMFTGKAYALKAQKMNVTCPHCGVTFEREPGYFYVAMFVSYALSVAELVTTCVGTYILSGNLESPWLYLAVAFVTALVFAPFNFRYSRVILLYWLTPGLQFRPELFGDPDEGENRGGEKKGNSLMAV
ncbi:hypothetical protein SAMN05216436_11260 [bacterium A37T11]|nr:hypothetical protein SAMN05216436_11260 [bacterium A37T11]